MSLLDAVCLARKWTVGYSPPYIYDELLMSLVASDFTKSVNIAKDC